MGGTGRDGIVWPWEELGKCEREGETEGERGVGGEGVGDIDGKEREGERER